MTRTNHSSVSMDSLAKSPKRTGEGASIVEYKSVSPSEWRRVSLKG